MPFKLLILATVGLCAGCTLFQTSVRNLCSETSIFFAERSLRHSARHAAKEAWLVFSGENPEWYFIRDFEKGFKEGFVDYLDNGGNAEPPAVPPLHYRKNKYLNPEGFQAIDRYFAGFACGARLAKDSGLRDTLVVPVLVPLDSEPTVGSRQPTHEPPPARDILPTPAIPQMSPTIGVPTSRPR